MDSEGHSISSVILCLIIERMMDFTSPKVLVPAALFALLSPGVLLSLPSMKFASMESSRTSILIHALVLAILYWAIVKLKLFKTTLTRADIIVPALLFALLSPPVQRTSYAYVGISTILFILMFTVLRSKFPQYY